MADCTTDQVLKDPEKINTILNAIQSISSEARRALADPELERADLLAALSVRLLKSYKNFPPCLCLRLGTD